MIVRPFMLAGKRAPEYTLTAGLLVTAIVQHYHLGSVPPGAYYGRVRAADSRHAWVDLMAEDGTTVRATVAYTAAECAAGDVMPRTDRNTCASCAREGAGEMVPLDGRRAFLCYRCTPTAEERASLARTDREESDRRAATRKARRMRGGK